jgi:hypothetical protein
VSPLIGQPSPTLAHIPTSWRVAFATAQRGSSAGGRKPVTNEVDIFAGNRTGSGGESQAPKGRVDGWVPVAGDKGEADGDVFVSELTVRPTPVSGTTGEDMDGRDDVILASTTPRWARPSQGPTAPLPSLQRPSA